MRDLTGAQAWTDPAGDPNDETFGAVVEPADLADDNDYDAVLVGEPYDGAVIGRTGAREGPAALREALAGTKTHHFDAGPVRSVADLGDVEFRDADVATAQATVAEVAGAVHEVDAFPVFLGGDNSLTVGNAGALLGADWRPGDDADPDRSVGVVNLDAHLDVREVRDGPTSGTPYRQLLDAGLDAYACVGARHFETSTAYHDVLREHDGAVVTAEEVGEDPVDAGLRALDSLGDVDAVYLSLDLDVLDAAAAPGVSAPTPGGVSARECFRLLRVLAGDERVAGFEVVECAPPLDEGGRTAAAGARAVAHVLAGVGASA